MPRGGAGLRNHGATDGRSRRRPAGYVLHGRARWVTAEWDDMDVHADERLPFGALAEVDLPPAKWCRVSIWRSPDRARINRPNPARLELMIGRCDRQANKIACAPKIEGKAAAFAAALPAQSPHQACAAYAPTSWASALFGISMSISSVETVS